MGGRVDLYGYYENFTLNAGTWTEIYYWGRGHLTVRAHEYQAGSVSIFSPNTPFVHLTASLSAWGVHIDALPWSSSIDVYGLSYTYIKLNYGATGGNHDIAVASPGKNEVSTGDGNDYITIKQGGLYSFIDAGGGSDTINLNGGISTCINKSWGNIRVTSSTYRFGYTEINAYELAHVSVDSSSYSFYFNVNRVYGSVYFKVYAVKNINLNLGYNRYDQKYILGSETKVELWTGDGDDSVEIWAGGVYSFVDLKAGSDSVLLGRGWHTDIYKGNGSLRVDNYDYRGGNSIVRAGWLYNLYVKLNAWGVDVSAHHVSGSLHIDVYGLGWSKVWLGSSNSINQNITIGSPGTVELWTGDGSDNIWVTQGGRSTYISSKGGSDSIYLNSGVHTYIQKSWGGLFVRSSMYRAGRTTIDSPELGNVDIESSSEYFDFKVGRVYGSVHLNIYASYNIYIDNRYNNHDQWLRLGALGKIEVWTGNGNDTFIIYLGGHYVYLNTANGFDSVYLYSGVNVIIDKNDGSLSVAGNVYRAGYTTINAGNINDLFIESKSYNNTLNVKSLSGYGRLSLHAVDFTRIDLGSGYGKADIYVSSSRKNEVWANDGDNYVNVNQGGFYSFVDFKNGKDSLTFNWGFDCLLYKGLGSFRISTYQYLAGYFSLTSKTSNIKQLDNTTIKASKLYFNINDNTNTEHEFGYIKAYALAYAEAVSYTGSNAISWAIWAGSSGKFKFSGLNLVRVSSLSSVYLEDFGGCNGYILGKKHGPLTVWSELNLNNLGVFFVEIVGESSIINNNSQTGDVFIANVGGWIFDFKYYKGGNGLFNSKYSSRWTRNQVTVGENGYADNYVVNASENKGVINVNGVRNVVVDASEVDAGSLVSGGMVGGAQTNNSFVLKSAVIKSQNDSGDTYYGVARYTNGAQLTIGSYSKINLKLMGELKDNTTIKVYLFGNSKKLEVYNNDTKILNFYLNLNGLDEVVIDLGNYGEMVVFPFDRLDRVEIANLTNASVIYQYTDEKAALTRAVVPTVTELDNYGGGGSATWMFLMLSKSIQWAKQTDLISKEWVDSSKVFFSNGVLADVDYKERSDMFYFSLAKGTVTGSQSVLDKATLELLGSGFFKYIGIGFFEDYAEKKPSLLSVLNSSQLSYLSWLVSYEVMTDWSIFLKLSYLSQIQIVKNVFSYLNFDTLSRIGILDLNLFPAIAFGFFNYNALVKIYDSSQFDLLEQAAQLNVLQNLNQYEQKIASYVNVASFMEAIALFGKIPVNAIDSLPEDATDTDYLNLVLSQTNQFGSNGYLYLADFFTSGKNIWMGWFSQIDLFAASKELTVAVTNLKSAVQAWDAPDKYKGTKALLLIALDDFSNDLKSLINYSNYYFGGSVKSIGNDLGFYIHWSKLFYSLGVIVRYLSEVKDKFDRIDLAIATVNQVSDGLNFPKEFLLRSFFKLKPDGSLDFLGVDALQNFVAGGQLSTLFLGTLKSFEAVQSSRVAAMSVGDFVDGALPSDLDDASLSSAGSSSSSSLSEAVSPGGGRGELIKITFKVLIFEAIQIVNIAFAILKIQSDIEQMKALREQGELTDQLTALFAIDIVKQLAIIARSSAFFVENLQPLLLHLVLGGFIRATAESVEQLSRQAFIAGNSLSIVVGAISFILNAVQIDANNVFIPVLGMIQDLAFIVLDALSIAFPFLAPVFSAIEALFPSLQAIGIAAIFTDQLNLVKEVGKILGVDVTVYLENNGGYLESCAIFKTMYLIIKAQYDQAAVAAMPLGSIFGMIGAAAAKDVLLDSIWEEPDYSDSMGVSINPVFNFVKTALGERVIYSFYTQAVYYLPGGSGLIEWIKFSTPGGSVDRIKERVGILANLYKKGIQFFFNFSSGHFVQYPDGSPLASETILVMTNIGLYSGVVKQALPEHMYHEAWKDNKSVDLQDAFIRQTSIDSGIVKGTISAICLGLSGGDLTLRNLGSFVFNLFIVGDVNNSKGKIQHLYIQDGKASVSVDDATAQKHIILHGGSGYNSFFGALEMYGGIKAGTTDFLLGFNTKLVVGRQFGTDTVGIVSTVKNVRLTISDYLIYANNLGGKEFINSEAYYINNYFNSSPSEYVFIDTKFQAITVLMVTQHASHISSDSNLSYIAVAPRVAGVRVDHYQQFSETLFRSSANIAVSQNAAMQSVWLGIDVMNGGFENGLHGWSSDYIPMARRENSAAVVGSVDGWGMGATQSHSGGAFLLVDPSPASSGAFYRYSYDIGSPTNWIALRFSFWLMQNDTNAGKVQLLVNGNPMGDYATAAAQDGWIKVTQSFALDLKGQQVVRLELVDLVKTVIGNDIGIDDITLERGMFSGRASARSTIYGEIFNGSFESGYDNFFTQYSTTGPIGMGKALVSSVFPDWGFTPKGAHTGRHFLLVDGVKNATVWQETIQGIGNGDTVSLEFYMAGGGGIPASLSVYVNGMLVATGLTALPNEGWKKQQASFKSWFGGEAVIQIKDDEGNPAGNDFALDTMSLKRISASLPETTDVQLSVNHIVNPDFNQDGGFRSDYSQVNGLSGYGQYTFTSIAPQDWGLSASSGYNQEGRFMMVDGALEPGKVVWEQMVSLPKAGRYLFSYRLMGNAYNPAEIQLSVNGVAIGHPALPNMDDGWGLQQFIFNVEDPRNVKLTLTNLNTNWWGNDFGLDHFSLIAAPDANIRSNLVVNGRFEEGYTGWSGDYVYGDTSSSGHAQVVKVAGPETKFSQTESVSRDHFLLARGGNLSNADIWRESIDLIAGQSYTFSYKAIGGPLEDKFQLYVDGKAVGSVAPTHARLGWEEYTIGFVASKSGKQTVSLKNIFATSTDNWFALDDLELFPINGPLSFAGVEGNQFDGFNARANSKFKLKAKEDKPPLSEEAQALQDQFEKDNPISHFPTENTPWQALAAQNFNNTFEFNVPDMLDLKYPTKVYLTANDKALVNKVNLSSFDGTEGVFKFFERSDIYVDVRNLPEASRYVVVGDHPVILNDTYVSVYAKGREVTNIYSLSGSSPSFGIYLDSALIYQNQFNVISG